MHETHMYSCSILIAALSIIQCRVLPFGCVPMRLNINHNNGQTKVSLHLKRLKRMLITPVTPPDWINERENPNTVSAIRIIE